MKKLIKMFWYVVMRFLMLVKGALLFAASIIILLFCWVYSNAELDYAMEWIDEHIDKRFRLFG